MSSYKIGSIGDLISGNSNGAVETKTIVFKELAARPKKIPSSDGHPTSKENGSTSMDLLAQVAQCHLLINKAESKVKPTISRKRKAEIAGNNFLDSDGVSLSHDSERNIPLNDSVEYSKADKDKSQDENTFKQNAARRVHLKNNSRKHVDNPERNSRTIFVGNIPYAHSDKKTLTKLFSKYGEVESVRIRCAPLNDPRVSKKVAVIKHQFHPERSSINGYVVFKNSANAKSALEANGSLFHGHHLRVDSVGGQKQFDPKKSVFVGNFPFAAEEEDLWQLFAECGAIESVRIVRDTITSVSKGIAYVNFQTSDAAELALQLNGTTFKKREISVSRSRPSAKPASQKPQSAKPVRHVGTDAKAKIKIRSEEEKRNSKKAKRTMRREGEKALGILRKKKKKNDASDEFGKKTVLKLDARGTEQRTNEASSKSDVKEGKKNKLSGFRGQTVEESKKKKRKINRGAQRKKKIALLLSGGKKKT